MIYKIKKVKYKQLIDLFIEYHILFKMNILDANMFIILIR